jgi:dUTP pyrophosphatase
MEVLFKKLDERAVAPKRGTDWAAGYDLTAIGWEYVNVDPKLILLKTGLALAIPKGYYGELVARSSLPKHGLAPASGHGVIDADYRGEVKFMVRLTVPQIFPRLPIELPLRFGQLLIKKHESPLWVEVEELPKTKRGTGGFGSTGS